MNQINLDNSRAEIGSLLDPAGHGNTASDRLAGCGDLYQVEQAKAAPTSCLATNFHAKITLRPIDTGRLAS